MPQIKVYPPTQLPDRGVSETQFKIWLEELEVYLSQEDKFRVFLEEGDYAEWKSQENNPDRLTALLGGDLTRDNRTGPSDIVRLKDRCRDLRTVLSIVGKCVSQGHYEAVVRHSTSMKSIFKDLRSDYDIQQKGIHFLNILDMNYDASKLTPIAFYNQYRTLISNNMAKTNDVIKYKSETLLVDEKMSPMVEDMVLLNVIREIDHRLPGQVRTHYTHKMSKTERLMDFKSDIMTNIAKFIQELDKEEQLSSIKAGNDPRLSWINHQKGGNQRRQQPGQNRWKKPGSQDQRLYCRLCHKCDMPRDVFTSHNLGDKKCTQLSAQDRAKLAQTQRLANISTLPDEICLEEETEHDDYTKEFGYDDEAAASPTQVTNNDSVLNRTHEIYRCNEKLSYIAPVPTQLLTVFKEENNTSPAHIDIDSGATLNYAREKEVLELGCQIFPNGQLSTLGDGRTRLPSIGEIDVSFFRNKWTIRFRALVTKELQSAFIGGTVFMVDNFMEQDLNRRLIHLHNRKVTVQETNPVSLMPIQPMLQRAEIPLPVSACSEVSIEPNLNPRRQVSVPNKGEKLSEAFGSTLHKCNSLQVILPGQTYELHIDAPDNEVVAVQPWEQNKNPTWPKPQLCTVAGRKVLLDNDSLNPVILKKDVQFIRILSTSSPPLENDDKFYSPRVPSLNNIKTVHSENVNEISFGDSIDPVVKEDLIKAHELYKDVFNKDLTHGYNDFYGKHRCELNWATNERPLANKVRVPNYNHDLQGLQQELMDDLTDQGVLLVPQEHDLLIQAVCPSFLQRKQRAKVKPQHMLTKDDVRLLINFGPINDKIKPIPSHVATTDDVLIKLGRWKELIIFDLYNGYFQIKMSDKSIPWLGVQTPFGGLRAISRSGQGLLGQAEEFDEVLAKVLKEELKEGICTKIVDDIYVGGANQKEASINYIRILSRLGNANLKISPTKTHIFPTSVDVLGWVWKRGGFLSPSPHRQCALTNVKQEDIKKVKDMRSWVGLYKTLHIATPKITSMLEPFETASAGKDTKDRFEWNHELEQQFRLAKNHVQNMKTLYLPSPDDQLLLFPDGSKMTPGIGHILYAVVDGKRLPVRFHTFKLKDNCRKWSPCEIEALALAAGIEKEFDLLRESKLPIIICPDSKPVHDAVSLINNGKFSTNSRMTSFLANINRLPIISQHVSGKAKLNPFADLQSRAPSDCSAEICTIHKFVDEAIDGVIDPGAKNSGIAQVEPYSNRISWLKAQQKNPPCAFAKTLLTTGKPPPKAVGKHAGSYYNEVRFYCREATISRDGLLVVKTKPDAQSGNISRERIIIPKLLVPALLYHLHNHGDKHQTRNQQKITFQRQFHAMDLDKHLDDLYKGCYKCLVIQKLPKELVQHESKQVVEGPHTNFHADVIKRASQLIFTIKDHFSSLQNAILIESEKSEDLKNALILLSSTMRKPDLIHVTVDNAPGFNSLINNKDKDLEALKIVLVSTDEFNKNANAVIDKGCQELEEELMRLAPEGNKISQTMLAQTILSLNQKMRRKGTISAYEIHTARDLYTGENLHLDDNLLRHDQLQRRNNQNAKSENHINEVLVGDTVLVHNRQDKHKARDMFIVTAKERETVEVQKILHPLVEGKGRIMSKVYQTDQKRLKTVHRQYQCKETVDDDDSNEVAADDPLEKPIETEISWNPIDKKFFNNDSDEEEDYIDQNLNCLPQDCRDNTLLGDLFLTDEENTDDEPQQGVDNDSEELESSDSEYDPDKEVRSTTESDESDDVDSEESDADIEDNDGSEEECDELDEFSNKRNNPRELPKVNDRISYWDPDMAVIISGTVTPMTRELQRIYPGWRNLLKDGENESRHGWQ